MLCPPMVATSSNFEARRKSCFSLLVLGLMFAIGALVVATPQSATLFGINGPTCPSRWILPDHGCPGCGLTRGTALILDGEFRAANAVQPAAWLVVLLGAAAAALHAVGMVRPKNYAWIARLLSIGRVVFLIGLLTIWLVRLASPY